MSISALVIGYGSIGQKHAKILKYNFKIKNLTICSKKKLRKFNTIKNLHEIKKKPNYIVIASPASKHLKCLKFIEKNFKGALVLVEKPLFHKYKKLNIKRNKVFVGYNLRFHPIIKYIKKKIHKRKIIDIKIFCNSYLPDWRQNIDYNKSSSALKNLGGGVVLDLSHELDLVRWIFGEVVVKFVKIGKFSNLSINTEDLLKLYGTVGKTNLSIDLNYYSKIHKRTIFVDGNNFSIFADLINNKIEIKNKKKYFIKRFPNFKMDNTYVQQHKSIFLGKTKNVCNYAFALKTMKLIDKIKNWKNKYN